jgi:hypothetical protein
MGAPKKKILRYLGPYGWELVPEGEGYIPRPLATEIWVIRYIRQLRAFGCDLDEIIHELRCDGIRTRHGDRWSRAEISELLTRDDTALWERWRDRIPGPR